MSAGPYIAGVALLALTGVPLALGSVALRRWALPGWRGAPARLAEVTAAFTALLLTAEVLGAFGAFRRGALAGCCAAIGLAAFVVLRMRPARAIEKPLPQPAPVGRFGAAVSIVTVALVCFEWASRSVEVLSRGMADPDTLWYHMPFAATFAQHGWTTRLIYTQSEPITTFHPAGVELLHGIGISLFAGHDLLSPFVNFGFGALTLLAAWCLGRRYGVAPAAMVGAAIVLSAPIVLQTQPGEAANDQAGVAWLLAAVALMANSELRNAPLAFAAAAAGMALSTKLSLLAPVGLLSLALLAALPRPGRWRAWGWWLVLALVTGGFWYGRNLLRTGNPLPWYRLGPLDLPSPPLPQTNKYSFSIAHYLGQPHIWRTDFFPGLNGSIGHVWPVVIVLAALGGLLMLVIGRNRLERGLGVTVLGGLVAYVVTPASAGGPDGFPVLFGLNLRFVTPPLALGLALLPTAPPLVRWRGWTLGLLGVVLVLTQWSASFKPPRAAGWGIVLMVALLAAAALLRSARPKQAVAAGLALAAALALYSAQHDYYPLRYAHTGPTLPGISVWAQRLHHQRIAISGYLLQYPLYGRDLSNTVEWVGHRGPHGAFSPVGSCAEWRALLARGHYGWVVTAPVGSVVLASPTKASHDPPEAAWTRSDPGARQVLREPLLRATVFRLDGPPTDAGCASATVSRSG